MRKLITKIAIAVAGISGVATAQQDVQFTQWMHNRLIYNPGYAGTTGAICGVAQFRQQWASFEGAPQSIAVAADMPIPELPIGVGLNIINDRIGPMNSLYARLAGSFLIPIDKGTLGIGIDAGILQKRINQTWVAPEEFKLDPTIPGTYGAGANNDFRKTGLDLGGGVFYQIPSTFYIGLSSGHLAAQTLQSGGSLKFDVSRHYYFMTGYTFKLNPRHWLTPNVFVKSDLAATAIDANLTYMWNEQIWVGGSYRFGDAGALMVGFQNMNAKKTLSYKIGYSYDLTTSKFKGYTGGSHEIILGVCFIQKEKKIIGPDDPRFLN